MAKRKEIDNLALDAADALAAGTSYGKWKPHHPNTKDQRESNALARIMAERKKCAHCGKPIMKAHARDYCSATCRKAANNAKYRERSKAKKEAAACKG